MENTNELCWCCAACMESRVHTGRTVAGLYSARKGVKETSSPHSGGALSPEHHPGVPQLGTSPVSPHHQAAEVSDSDNYNCKDTGEGTIPFDGNTLMSQLLQEGLSPYHSALVGINNYPVRQHSTNLLVKNTLSKFSCFSVICWNAVLMSFQAIYSR